MSDELYDEWEEDLVSELMKIEYLTSYSKDETTTAGKVNQIAREALMKAQKKSGGRKEVRQNRLSTWDWETLVAAWRYYEGRSTIAAAMFPGEIVQRFWGVDGLKRWDDSARKQIANQFVFVDHGIRGLEDFRGEDGIPWRLLYSFLRDWMAGFAKVRASDGNKEEVVECFLAFGEYYPAQQYIDNPFLKCIIPAEYIMEVL